MKKILFGIILFFASLSFANDLFGGIGLVVQEQEDNAGISIEYIIPKMPAANSKLNTGDLIIAVDGENLKGNTFGENLALIRDLNNKPIQLTYVRDGDTLQTTLRRTMITTVQIPSSDASVNNINGKTFISIIALGNDNYKAVFLDNISPAFKKHESGSKDRLSGIRLLQIRENIISFEKKSKGKIISIDLNGQSRLDKIER